MTIAYLRRKPKHVIQCERVTFCGFTIPERDRWRLREGRYATCWECTRRSGLTP